MAYEHPSGLPNAYDRAQNRADQQSVVFTGDQFIQGAELNELQTIIRGRHDRLGKLVAADGDRSDGATAIVQADLGNVILTAGSIYIQGDVLPVAQSVISDVSMVGRVEIGVRISRSWVTGDNDPDLKGLIAGSKAEGENGAAREVVSIAWALADDGGDGAFVPVFILQDGTIIDQKDPAILTGYAQAIAIYDNDANGNYVVRGNRVTALGKVGNAQAFSVEEGVANIFGRKITRYSALRHVEVEQWDAGAIDGEPHTYVDDGGSCVITLAHTPIAGVSNVLITKEVTENVTRGATANGSDALGHNSVTEILSVTQGATTYVAGTDYARAGDNVDWSAAGSEPATGSSYSVQYRYLSSVAPDATDDTTATVSGGVDGQTAIVTYTYKMPRIDCLCIDQNGQLVYLKGISAAKDVFPPSVPADLLALGEITNNWIGKPAVKNTRVRSIPFEEQWRRIERLEEMDRLLQLERLRSSIDAREPVAKLDTFVDPFADDTYRDAGVAQTASVADGFMELAIDPTFYTAALYAPVLLDYVEEVVISQELITGCVKINEYANFSPLPGQLLLNPPADFWTEKVTQWASAVTQEFTGSRNSTSTTTQLVSSLEEQAEFLRQIEVGFTINGFGTGEILDEFLFAGIDVTPAGPLSANAQGTIVGTFVIPSNVPAGTVEVSAKGAGGTEAFATWTGQGTIEISVMRRVTTVTRAPVVRERHETGSFNSSPDPQAETFAMTEARQLVGVDFHLCATGDETKPVVVNQVSVSNGIPTTDILAEAFLGMAGQDIGWKSPRYPLPLTTPAGQTQAFVIKTDDNQHSVSIANLGDFDEAAQKYVAAQPYTVGVRLSSSNAETWTAHQNSDLAFRVVAAKYTSLTKTVPLGNFDLVQASDLVVRAVVELPSADCSVVFEIVRANGQIWRLAPYQRLQLTEYITETVQLRAVLKGTEKLSPILYAPVMLVAGKIRATGDYVSRAFKLGAAVRLTAYFEAKLPAGASVSAKYDLSDGNWIDLPLISSEQLADASWAEEKHEIEPITGTTGRLKLIVTGGPGARPQITDLSAAVF